MQIAALKFYSMFTKLRNSNQCVSGKIFIGKYFNKQWKATAPGICIIVRFLNTQPQIKSTRSVKIVWLGSSRLQLLVVLLRSDDGFVCSWSSKNFILNGCASKCSSRVSLVAMVMTLRCSCIFSGKLGSLKNYMATRIQKSLRE